jgi:hypothetical protein
MPIAEGRLMAAASRYKAEEPARYAATKAARYATNNGPTLDTDTLALADVYAVSHQAHSTAYADAALVPSASHFVTKYPTTQLTAAIAAPRIIRPMVISR